MDKHVICKVKLKGYAGYVDKHAICKVKLKGYVEYVDKHVICNSPATECPILALPKIL